MGVIGKAVRMTRLKNSGSGRILTVAFDHVPSHGLMKGLEDIQKTIDCVASTNPDAMLLMKGPAELCFKPYAGRIPLMLKCSLLLTDHDVLVSSVEDAIKLGADAVAMTVIIGSRKQPEILDNLTKLIHEAEIFGMPVIAHAYPCGELIPQEEQFSVKQVGYASRLVMEMGVDIVKTFYTGSAETFSQIVKIASPAFIVASGGPKLDTDRDVLQMTKNVIDAGAAGITFGRNVWQNNNINGMMSALKHIVHNNGSVEDAMKKIK